MSIVQIAVALLVGSAFAAPKKCHPRHKPSNVSTLPESPASVDNSTINTIPVAPEAGNNTVSEAPVAVPSTPESGSYDVTSPPTENGDSATTGAPGQSGDEAPINVEVPDTTSSTSPDDVTPSLNSAPVESDSTAPVNGTSLDSAPSGVNGTVPVNGTSLDSAPVALNPTDSVPAANDQTTQPPIIGDASSPNEFVESIQSSSSSSSQTSVDGQLVDSTSSNSNFNDLNVDGDHFGYIDQYSNNNGVKSQYADEW